ncbi:adenosylcobinamide amidohydrolase [Krasilnikovia sp. M28-CT-15]|uniref:adenosylcobinamide amidohydrolase n=1 Tax=Krasilnikovia sp. M28-CT-15 TaxID=3373540 RepID=UPI00387779B6
MIAEPVPSSRTEQGCDIPLLVWRLPEPALAVSSAVVGGGIGPCRWVVNATVPMSYDRDDPDVHLREIAAGLGLTGPGVGLLTGVDVADVVAVDDGEVRLWATVGLSAPVQAAATTAEPEPHAGTVNLVAWVPQQLTGGALVNAVATITEAKTQAIRELGLAATGTATDAVAVLCPPTGPAASYAGPRAPWGRRLADAAFRAVLDGGAANLAGPPSWSDRQDRRTGRPGNG